MDRPYSKLSIEALEQMFSDNSRDRNTLDRLLKELDHRGTKRARRLTESVKESINALSPAGQKKKRSDSKRRAAKKLNKTKDSANNTKKTLPKAETYKGNSTDPDQPPDDRRCPDHLTAVRPLGVSGVPSAWEPPLAQDIQLDVPPDAKLPDIYISALGALIIEIRRTGAGQKRYELERGQRVDAPAGEIIYEFPFRDEADLFVDARVQVEVPGIRTEATVVAVSDGRLTLALDDDLGPKLDRAVIVVDATKLLQALKERLEQAKQGEVSLNTAMADAVVGRASQPSVPDVIPFTAPAEPLDASQEVAFRRALRDAITFIWGPPGCGKTRTLAPLVRAAFDAGKRVLICSNTNKAVDQVLYRICRELDIDHPAMRDGQVLRLGRIADDKLRKFHDYVTLDGIAERLTASLHAHHTELRQSLEQLDARSALARRMMKRFADLDAAEDEIKQHRERVAATTKRCQDLRSSACKETEKFKKLYLELERRGGFLSALLRRSETEIKADISNCHQLRERIEAEEIQANQDQEIARTALTLAQRHRDSVANGLSGKDRRLFNLEVRKADNERTVLVEKLREIDGEINTIRSNILRNARIIGATCTKTYLSVKEIGKADLVVVDEASMVMLPAVWFVSGMATERVVICGDFRQIPPIVATRQQRIHDVLAPDIFTVTGRADPNADDHQMVMIDQQYRMDESICSLISQPMYGGRLTTASSRPNNGHPAPSPPFQAPLTIIDTSDLWPFESVNAFHSRYNLMHALLVRNLAWHFQRQGYLKDSASLGVCTPYAAQNKIIGRLLDDDELKDVQVGTVHSFQGDERNAVILEIPESHGGPWMLGRFVQGVEPGGVGARLINVAVSRAQNHLIVLANLTHLDKLLPSLAILRGLLHDMQERGSLVPGSEVLALRPIDRDLQGLGRWVKLDQSAQELGLFDQSTFDAALASDLQAAEESAVIFSGFVTPTGVANLGELLRSQISAGRKVRCVTRPPHRNGSMDPALGKEALDMLEGIGCVVDCRARIHEKIIIIDRKIVWLGSLNALSHNHRTDEVMTRVVNASFADALAANVSKRQYGAQKALAAIAEPENPRCGACGGRTVYSEGKYGPFFHCEEETCDWKINLRSV